MRDGGGGLSQGASSLPDLVSAKDTETFTLYSEQQGPVLTLYGYYTVSVSWSSS